MEEQLKLKQKQLSIRKDQSLAKSDKHNVSIYDNNYGNSPHTKTTKKSLNKKIMQTFYNEYGNFAK